MNLINRFINWILSFFIKKEEIKEVFKAPRKLIKPFSEAKKKYLENKKYKRSLRNINCHFATTKGFTIKT